MSDHEHTCGVDLAPGRRCGEPVEPSAPLALCTHHLLEAHDHVASRFGVTDLLPGPCLACGARLGVRYPSGWMCAICEWRVGDLPDGEAPSPRVDVVYYLRYRDRVKIGTSGNPRVRFSSLLHDEVLAFERGDRLVEHRRHVQFASHRIPRTEWFEANDELTALVAELRAGVDDPWAQYARWVSERLSRA
jgi:hypothetical protein